MKTVLVSGASGIVGYGILRSLRASGLHLRLIGTSIYDDSVAPAFCDIFELAPPTADPAYLDWLLGMIDRHRINLIIPGIEADMYHWVEHIPAIEAHGAIALLNNVDLIHLCKDKWQFYVHLHDAGVACAIRSSLTPDFTVLAADFGLPFLLKPRRGFGSKGIVRVDNPAVFASHQAAVGPLLMAQPIVGTDDEEYTTSAFCDGCGGFHAGMTLRRKLSKEGYTEKAEVVETDDFNAAIADLCKRLLPRGPTNFQFRRTGEGVMLLEINPRISSSTSMRTAFGYNESAMAVTYYLEHRVPSQPPIRRGRAVRYTTEHIFYEDRPNL
jgi:carbamoyl-phosphate synthase large subunit